MDKEKPYFPFLLGNGVDCVLIDYSGSMGCISEHLHREQHQGAIYAWYKATHRDYEKPLFPILQATYSLIATGGESYEVEEFSQSFNPRKAILITIIKATDFKIKVETFLTSNQILVEHYHILKLPEGKVSINFNLHPPYTTANNIIHLPVKTYYKFLKNFKEKEIICDYRIGKIKGRAVMYTDYKKVSIDKFHQGKKLIITNPKEGDCFTRYLLVLDEIDAKDYKREIRERIDKIKKSEYLRILNSHKEEGEKYQSQSYLNLPDKNLEYLYYTSLYLIRAHQNPYTGLISIGNYPILWGGGVVASQDLMFVHKALLSSNRIKESECLILGYKKTSEMAKNYAQKIGSRGFYFPWFMNYEGKSLNFISPEKSPGIQKFNNACIVMEIWDQFLYTGDKTILKKFWDLIKNVVDFLCDEVIEKKTGEIKEMEGIDESILRKNDTAHLLTSIKALEILIEVSKILNKKISSEYQRVLRKLRFSLKKNYSKGILLEYRGAKRITTNTFYFYFIEPKVISKEAVKEILKRCEGKLGLTNPGPYQNLIWPWAEFKASYVLSHFSERKKAFFHLLRGAQYTSCLGGFPEKIRPDGFSIGYWFITCHATYVLALTSILACFQDNVLKILPSIPSSWENLEFKNLRIPPGILVSLKLQNKRIKFLSLKNLTSLETKIRLEIPHQYKEERKIQKYISLKPGIDIIIS
ncbi:hypothetical protein J7K25_04200 [bacterium]|nr:hypothetical protein [bacterium]